MVVIFQLLMPILILSQIFFIPETPRWLLQHGNNVEKARASLRRVRDSEQDVEDEILMIREALEFEKEAISSSYSALWKDPSVRKRLLLAFVINAGQQITGQGTLNSYSTIIYKKIFKDTDTIALINALNATFAIFFTLNAAWTVDRWGRKFLLIVGGIGMAICMVAVAALVTESPTSASGAKSHPVGIAVVFLLFLFAFFCKSHITVSHIVSPTNFHVRQAILGSHCLDLDIGGFLHERSRPSCRYGLANPKRRQLDCPTILPHLPRQLWLLRLLHVCRNQRLACPLRLVHDPRDQGCPARGD